LRGKARKEMQERLFDLYGGRCFECRKKLRIGKNFTLDHIVAKSSDGAWLPTNLQPFCRKCQVKKRDLPVETIVCALHMYLRPAPSDGYDGLVW
jgi:5-methylcytosine-specific restriction endonuclease McrA